MVKDRKNSETMHNTRSGRSVESMMLHDQKSKVSHLPKTKAG